MQTVLIPTSSSACAACSRRAAEVRVAGLLEFVRGVVEVFGSARAFLRESAGPLARGLIPARSVPRNSVHGRGRRMQTALIHTLSWSFMDECT